MTITLRGGKRATIVVGHHASVAEQYVSSIKCTMTDKKGRRATHRLTNPLIPRYHTGKFYYLRRYSDYCPECT